MINRIRADRLGSALRLAVLCGLAAAALSGTLGCPAHADNANDKDNDHKNLNEPRQEQAHQQNTQRTHWQEQHRSHDNYGQPGAYYTAPPVVYAPPGYYQQQSGLSLTFGIPFLYQ
jgi:hypothetical protein